MHQKNLMCLPNFRCSGEITPARKPELTAVSSDSKNTILCNFSSIPHSLNASIIALVIPCASCDSTDFKLRKAREALKSSESTNTIQMTSFSMHAASVAPSANSYKIWSLEFVLDLSFVQCFCGKMNE